MRTLIKSFSLAALFSLTTACAVDDEPTNDAEEDLVSCTDCMDEAAAADDAGDTTMTPGATGLPPRTPQDQDEEGDDDGFVPIPPYSVPNITRWVTELDDKLEDIELDYCEQNDDCESQICDQVNNVCRDYPF